LSVGADDFLFFVVPRQFSGRFRGQGKFWLGKKIQR